MPMSPDDEKKIADALMPFFTLYGVPATAIKFVFPLNVLAQSLHQMDNDGLLYKDADAFEAIHKVRKEFEQKLPNNHAANIVPDKLKEAEDHVVEERPLKYALDSLLEARDWVIRAVTYVR